MSDTLNRVESHGCIVCGKLFTLLVVDYPSGQMAGCTVTSPGGNVVPDRLRPLVACNTHSGEQIKKALDRHYPGKEQEEDRGD
jgi:hypothetical protein